MKLKNLLIITFLALTLTPIAIVSILLYKSGFELSQESYTKNLVESINVQSDYISQAIEGNMIFDYRFTIKNVALLNQSEGDENEKKSDLLTAFQSYLEASEDKISVCILLSQTDQPLYAIGESAEIENIIRQLPAIQQREKQTISEFILTTNDYSLGVITPARNAKGEYLGSLVSVYDKSYVFKIISSYYRVSDTSTYIVKDDGELINYKGDQEKEKIEAILKTTDDFALSESGMLNLKYDNKMLKAYYKNIKNSPWYLVAFVDKDLVQSFTNRFVLVYILAILIVLVLDMLLAVYISKRVVRPINELITVIDGYPQSLNDNNLQTDKNGYYETKYLKTKFLKLMKTISLIRHNFDGIYQLYESGDISETLVDIDVKNQTATSNKVNFQDVMDSIEMREDACIVERFASCFCEKDTKRIMSMLEKMRDEHLSITAKLEVYTPYLGQKWYNALIVPMYEDDRLARLFIQLHDVSTFKIQEFAAVEKAQRDQLTGLYNREGFTTKASDVLANSTAQDTHALLFMDMNYFKMVNDNFGHSTGDKLLSFVADMLLSITQEKDIVSRFGGDEFVVLITFTSKEQAVALKQQIEAQLVLPFKATAQDFTVSLSVGMSIWENHDMDTLENLLKTADSDMYKEKRRIKEKTING